MPDETELISNQTQSHNSSSIHAYGGSDQEPHWFPMRVAYNKDVMEIGYALEIQEIEYFLPKDIVVEPHAEGPKYKFRPKIADLIFVHTTKTRLTELKHNGSPCRYLRFITFIPHSDQRLHMTPMERSAANRIVIIPDDTMSIFMKIVDYYANQIELIPYSETFNHIGRKIRILQGPLAGTIGTLRRIKNNKHVHIDCGGILTVQLGYVPKEMYELVEN